MGKTIHSFRIGNRRIVVDKSNSNAIELLSNTILFNISDVDILGRYWTGLY